MNNELQHHGILGMKWGKRNGPPYPLEPGDHSASERKAGWRKSLDNKSENRASSRNNYLNGKSSGLTKQQKKVLMGVAVGAAVGLGVGAAYWYSGKLSAKNLINSDLVIPAGEFIKRISPASETQLHDRFYASIGKDANKYKALYADQLKKQGHNNIIEKVMTGKKDIRIAGNETCEKIFNDLKKNDDFKIYELVDYDTFNRNVMNDRGFDSFLYNKFYDKLKELGYDGFIDRNDQSYSNYFAKAPLILFNDSTNSNFSIESTNKIEPKVADLIKEYAKIIPQQQAKEAYENGYKWVATQSLTGLSVGAYVGIAAAKKDNKKMKT